MGELCGQQGIDAAGLCLACPAIDLDTSAEAIAALCAPVLVVWAEDDTVIPFSTHAALVEALRARSVGHTVFSPVATGGHRVDAMAAGSPDTAAKLAEWPDLA